PANRPVGRARGEIGIQAGHVRSGHGRVDDGNTAVDRAQEVQRVATAIREGAVPDCPIGGAELETGVQSGHHRPRDRRASNGYVAADAGSELEPVAASVGDVDAVEEEPVDSGRVDASHVKTGVLHVQTVQVDVDGVDQIHRFEVRVA